MRVREAVVADAPAIAEVDVHSWQDTYVGQVPQEYLDGLSVEARTDYWRRILAGEAGPATQVLLLLDDDDLVGGFALLRPSRDPDAGPNVVEAAAMYLRSDVRGQGWAQALAEERLPLLREAGLTEVTAWILDSNKRSRRVAEAQGFRFDGTTRVDTFGGRAVTELRYRLSL